MEAISENVITPLGNTLKTMQESLETMSRESQKVFDTFTENMLRDIKKMHIYYINMSRGILQKTITELTETSVIFLKREYQLFANKAIDLTDERIYDVFKAAVEKLQQIAQEAQNSIDKYNELELETSRQHKNINSTIMSLKRNIQEINNMEQIIINLNRNAIPSMVTGIASANKQFRQ